ncbi:MAG: TonB-dependent receptor [Caulobacteraceae bacterium]|nr:TonB-dependent receptor [Caulobacteraceae bacterium]
MISSRLCATRLRAALLISCAALAVAAPRAWAQDRRDEARVFDIPSEDLGLAVSQAARQAGREIIFSADLTRGRRAPELHGRMTLDQALDRLLAGSGIGRRTAGDGAIVLEAGPRPADGPDLLEEVIVTAQKRPERLSTVPISAMAITQDTLDRQGVKDIGDLARLAPGLTLQGSDDSGDMNIAIRGVISSVGAPTTGVYIDDVPIQVRQDAAVWSNPYPKIFDLDRVEVLRGPQGTLFGGGSEGGAVRFITPEASLRTFSGMARAEVADTDGGAPSWELGGAVGGPILTDRLGARISLWRREDGGYADRVDPVSGAVLGKNVNSSASTVLHLSIKAAPTARLTLTPSLFYQDVRDRDDGLFWEREHGDYTIASRIPEPHHDHMLLGAVGAEYDFDTVTVKSISAYIYRLAQYRYDSTQYEFASYIPDQLFLPTDPSYLVDAHFRSSQQSYSQELRASSRGGPDARLSWVGGLFFQHAREGYDAQYRDNMNELANYLSISQGGGPSDSLTMFGEAPVDGLYSFVRHYVDEEYEAAAYGDATLRVAPRLKLSAGVRIARTGFSYRDFEDGPWGPGAPTTKSGSQSETPVTPRFNATYELSDDRMVYASAAKGYRMGGVNQPVPASLCAADLNALGLTSAPTTYGSDSLWSYEAGIKGRFFNRAVLLESSLFWIDWSRIQQSVYLANCGYNYIANLGQATSRGFDAQAEWAVNRSLVLSAAVGFTDAYTSKTVSQDGTVLAQKGDPLSTPKWTATLSAEYRFQPWDGGDGYARLDEQYASAYFRQGSDVVYGSDPLIRQAPAVNVVNARLGVRFRGWDVSVFADNLLDAHTSIYRYRDSIDTTVLALRDERLRPLTGGLTIQRKY